jgi:hypothetical protein
MLLEEVIEFENGSMQLQLIFIKLQNRDILPQMTTQKKISTVQHDPTASGRVPGARPHGPSPPSG